MHLYFPCYVSRSWGGSDNFLLLLGLVNDQSGLQRNYFSKYTWITLIHHNVPQDFRFNLRYTYEGFISQKVLKL